VIAGPGPEGGRDRGGLRASRADREQVVELLKVAFVDDRLTRDDLDVRVGQALGARTYAELAVVTASIPAEPPADREPAPTPAQVKGEPVRPGAVALVATAVCGGVWALAFFPHWPVNSEGDPSRWLLQLFLMTNLIYVFTMVIAVGFMIVNWLEKRAPASPASGD